MTIAHPGPEWLLGALSASGFLFLAALAYPKGMGMGDVKLALLLGAMLGREVAVALMIGMIAALVPSVWLLATRGAAARKIAIPFGPFLAFGSVWQRASTTIESTLRAAARRGNWFSWSRRL